MRRLVVFSCELKNTSNVFLVIQMFLISKITEEMIERKEMEQSKMAYQVLMLSCKDVVDCKQARRNQSRMELTSCLWILVVIQVTLRVHLSSFWTLSVEHWVWNQNKQQHCLQTTINFWLTVLSKVSKASMNPWLIGTTIFTKTVAIYQWCLKPRSKTLLLRKIKSIWRQLNKILRK